MTLPHFDLHRAMTVDAATELLDRYGDDAVIHCGGTELLLVMKLGMAPYGHLVDVKGIPELRGIEANEDLWIGANTTHRQIERHADIRTRWAGLAEMTASVGNLRVRNVGTIGGNLCFSDPHSDPSTALLALDATVTCRRAAEEPRTLALGDFVVGPFETALRPGELLVGVRVPALDTAGTVLMHRKIAFHERAAATVAIVSRVVDNRLDHVRLAVGAVGNQPMLVGSAMEVLRDAPADALARSVVDEVADAAVAAGRPVTDAYGSADYKSHLLRVLVRRTLAEAVGTSPDM